ncbi:integral membrane protein PTH11 [Fusarium sp. NRRL 52700]|nr:integral membrane protein PTH11 [Fusarium sp. NRRL 52700]
MPQIEDRPFFIIESWTLYVVGTLILFARFAVRFKTVGWRGLQGDDFFSVLVLIFYAVDAFTVHLICKTPCLAFSHLPANSIDYLGTNIEAGVAAKSHTLTKDEIREYEMGSKLELAAWYAYTALIWCLKGTMLCFFSRMTIGTWHNMFVKTVSILCAVSYLAVLITITFGCFPTQKNWQVVPDPGEKCSFKMQNFLVTTVLNVLFVKPPHCANSSNSPSTDALILGIPMPLLWKLQVPFRKKLIIGLLLSSGAFVIAAAITRVVLTLSANPSALTVNAWGVRETIVGILTVNIPILRPIFSKSFWNGNAPTEITSSYRTTTQGTRGGNRTLTQDVSGMYELTPGINEGLNLSVKGSQDSIVSKNVKMADIVVSKSYQVSHDVNTYDRRSWYGDRNGASKASVHAESAV